ncbi:hypothetical protein Q1695_000679 [Nippostrongylus brasiliensis]|nr:hypothetical protein Q1695_000679 [Nippostrongylus brasiliensis]
MNRGARSVLFLQLAYYFLYFTSIGVSSDKDDDDYLRFLGAAMDKDVEIRRAEHEPHLKHSLPTKVQPKPFRLPGDYIPLPGRTTNSDYWPLYPMMNQYMAGVTYDTSLGRHTGGDVSVPIPWWGFLDMSGHIIERFQDRWVKVGYSGSPINMLGLRKDQIFRIISDPSLHWNRGELSTLKNTAAFRRDSLFRRLNHRGAPNAQLTPFDIYATQPSLPMAILPRNYATLSCKPPMCNPYHSSIGVGVEANYHIEDGVEGELDVPVPIGKGIGMRLPISGNIHYDTDDYSVTYGQNLNPVDPLILAPDPSPYQRSQRQRRDVNFFMPRQLNIFPVRGRFVTR